MDKFITSQTKASDEALNVVALLPTGSLADVVDPGFFRQLGDEQFIRVAVLLAQKSFAEDGCPIGAVIVDNETRAIVGKGHNTLVQEDHPYNHGETAAIRDAGRIDFSKTTLYTSLSPCDVCATLIRMRGFNRVVVGDVTNASGNEELLRESGVQVDICEDETGVALYAEYRRECPTLDVEDWRGVAALHDTQQWE